jgi:hypothetical protein
MQKMLNERLICHSSGNNKLALDIFIWFYSFSLSLIFVGC